MLTAGDSVEEEERFDVPKLTVCNMYGSLTVICVISPEQRVADADAEIMITSTSPTVNFSNLDFTAPASASCGIVIFSYFPSTVDSNTMYPVQFEAQEHCR
jgi:hypothetical protein